jgi:Baseplate hub gp41
MSGTTLDLRLMRVTFQVNAQLQTFDWTGQTGFTIRARGCKYANAQQNDCTLDIWNLDTATRNYILTETSPFNANRTPKVLTLYAGRQSTGLFQVYSGDIAISKISQPPDIGLTLKCGTLHFKKGKIGSRSGGSNQRLGTIATGVATNLGLSLNNQTKSRTVANYSFNGAALDEIERLNQSGVDAWVDDDHLILKEFGVPLTGVAIDLDQNSGMIGIPEITEQGLKVKFLFNSQAQLGGAINLVSVLNPAANGRYVIFKLSFDLTSREKDFYYTAECLRAKQ